MKKGILIFAHNNRTVDYALMSIIAAGLAKKSLNVPATLVTDESTIAWMKESKIFDKANEVFEKIIEVDRPETNNQRKLRDGTNEMIVPFVNSNRASAWELTPYDRTLLIDSDYFIFSDRLAEYWDVDEDVLVSRAMNDIYDEKRMGYHDRYISDSGVHLLWATTVMFTKNERSKAFFDLVNFIKDNYRYYGDLFRFDTKIYRNDIAFSIANHIMNGFETDVSKCLPPVLTTIDKDILHSVDESGKLIFLVTPMLDSNFCAVALKDVDVHIMNKQSITRNSKELLELL